MRFKSAKVTDPSSQVAHMKAALLMISMLGDGGRDVHCESGTDDGVSEVGDTALGSDGELNGVRLDCTGVRNVILLMTQSINGLCWASQLCPRMIAQEPSNGVM